MSKFNKNKKKESPAVSTASLPDIVFMLLFFFMVATVMREVDQKVEIERPSASEVTRLEDKSLVHYIYIGPSITPEVHGPDARIQLNDQIVPSEFAIPRWKEMKMQEVAPRDQPYVTTSLKVDKETQMGIVTRVKEQLREINALKINYSTLNSIVD